MDSGQQTESCLLRWKLKIITPQCSKDSNVISPSCLGTHYKCLLSISIAFSWKQGGPKLLLHQYNLVGRATRPKMNMPWHCGSVTLWQVNTACRVGTEVRKPQVTLWKHHPSLRPVLFAMSNIGHLLFFFLNLYFNTEFLASTSPLQQRTVKSDTTQHLILK